MAAIFLQPYKSVFGETIAEIVERGCVTGVAVSRKLIFGGPSRNDERKRTDKVPAIAPLSRFAL